MLDSLQFLYLILSPPEVPRKVGVIAVLQVRHLRLNQVNYVGVLVVSPSVAEWILAPGSSDLGVLLNHDKSRLRLAALVL